MNQPRRHSVVMHTSATIAFDVVMTLTFVFENLSSSARYIQ